MPQLRGCEGCGRWIAEDGPARCPDCSAGRPPARSRRTRGRKGQADRATVLERDRYRCRWPGCTETAETCVLEVHHSYPIEDFPELAGDLSLQITYCPTHHLEAARLYAATTDRRTATWLRPAQ